MKSIRALIVVAVSTLTCIDAYTQSQFIATESFEQLLAENQGLTAAELAAQYPPPQFQESVQIDFTPANYVGIAESALSLTDDEKLILHDQGFVVTERLAERTFLEQFIKVWRKDVPVFVSADVVLRAFHYNYVDLLSSVEQQVMIPQLKELLAAMHAATPQLVERYSSEPGMEVSLRDIDVYLTVARRLVLGNEKQIPAHFAENEPVVEELIALVLQAKPDRTKLFSSKPRPFDFSQFQPRGHYAKNAFGEPNRLMSSYFRAMMWLGRSKFVIDRDRHSNQGFPELSDEDVQRQVIDAALLVELMSVADCLDQYDEIESNLSFFAGTADSLNPHDLQAVLRAASVDQANELVSTARLRDVGLAARTLPVPPERIPSRFVSSSSSSDSTPRSPAYVFSLFGQRATPDGYILSSVVHGKVQRNVDTPIRLYPSTQDLLFALGNNESLTLLRPELEQFRYASNLGATRELLDSHPTRYWEESIYSRWLSCIRQLNPPAELDHLPDFMRTRQWWRQKMNTQLASWTQLRHDHLLYAPSSYTDTFGCSYPHGFVEPFPELYRSMHELGKQVEQKALQLKDGRYDRTANTLLDYAMHLQHVTSMLESISRKELGGEALEANETKFMKEVVFAGGYGTLGGWYVKLIVPEYEGDMFAQSNYDRLKDYIVADYHTTPTDERGNPIGVVSHAGTGKADLAIVAVQSCDGKTISYAGPVMSYYEYRTKDFERITDTEWSATHLSEAERPAWTKPFLIDRDGKRRHQAD